MNERIQKIANQCYYINTHTDLEMFDKEKFTELIVRDIADLNFRTLSFTPGKFNEISELILRKYGVTE